MVPSDGRICLWSSCWFSLEMRDSRQPASTELATAAEDGNAVVSVTSACRGTCTL